MVADGIRLRAGALEAVVSPEVGRLLRLRDLAAPSSGDVLVPLETWPAAPRQWARAGAYPLIPYSNRIAGSRLRHAGRVFELRSHPDASPHSLHGHSHLLPWSAEEVGPAEATLRLEAEPSRDWPWRFAAWQRFALTSQGLRVTLGIENRDRESFPAGLGWHPYLPWTPGSTLRHDAREWWPHGPDYLPLGERHALAAEDPARSLPTAYLSGWSRVDIDREGAAGVRITAHEALAHLVLHRAPDGSYVCVEPVSHLADGFNRAAEGLAGTGTRVLEPGESFTAWADLRIGPRDMTGAP